MRPLWKDILAAVWMGMILPGIVLNVFVWIDNQRESEQLPALQVLAAPEAGECILLQNSDGTYMDMDLDTYLTGVLVAEIPADFHEEALKAQSVAARTYAWKAHTTGGKHGDSSICTDPSCCQAYIGKDAYLSRGGNIEQWEKVRSAVLSTTDMVLLYDGELIEATYFSSSSGSTESAVAVWGSEYPYLQSVSSPEAVHEDVVCYSKDAFERLLGISLSGECTRWIGPVIYTEGKGVASIEICGETYTGVQLRSLLGLRSTAFRIETEEDKVKMITRGYGHRVGMSQYGANTMAEQGNSWQRILQHYYPGTTISPIS